MGGLDPHIQRCTDPEQPTPDVADHAASIGQGMRPMYYVDQRLAKTIGEARIEQAKKWRRLRQLRQQPGMKPLPEHDDRLVDTTYTKAA